MSFLQITRTRGTIRPVLDGVSLYVTRKKGSPGVTMSIGIEAMQRAAVAVGDWVYLGLGQDDDAGKIAIMAGASKSDGFRLCRNGMGASGRLQFTASRLGGEAWPDVKPTRPAYTAEPGRIVVTLPEALRNPPQNMTENILDRSGPMPAPHSAGSVADGAGATPCGAPTSPPDEPATDNARSAAVRPDNARRVRPGPAPGTAAPRDWTTTEIDTLKREWIAGTSIEKLQKLLPGRTSGAIYFKASQLKLGRRLGNNQHGVSTARQRELDAIEAARKAGKVTKCPPAYVGEVQGAAPVSVPVHDVAVQASQQAEGQRRALYRARGR